MTPSQHSSFSGPTWSSTLTPFYLDNNTISSGILIYDKLMIGSFPFTVGGRTTIFDINLSSYIIYQRSAVQDWRLSPLDDVEGYQDHHPTALIRWYSIMILMHIWSIFCDRTTPKPSSWGAVVLIISRIVLAGPSLFLFTNLALHSSLLQCQIIPYWKNSNQYPTNCKGVWLSKLELYFLPPSSSV